MADIYIHSSISYEIVRVIHMFQAQHFGFLTSIPIQGTMAINVGISFNWNLNRDLRCRRGLVPSLETILVGKF